MPASQPLHCNAKGGSQAARHFGKPQKEFITGKRRVSVLVEKLDYSWFINKGLNGEVLS